ncbi:MAG: dual specificity protein phosphatase family protein, partial [Treponema sp.]|nr:dual specificity protein phosphatase family protein [Treponema sp.]
TVSIYVNCAAGISRSGAVGYVLNLYFNKFLENNEHDYKLFNQNNSQIQPNPYVKSLLMSKFGLGY